MSGPSVISLRIPAQREYVTAIRALTRSTATLCALTVDDIEDLQMAVDEAATLLLPLADHGGEEGLLAEFEVAEGELQVCLSTRRAGNATLDKSGLAWIMLSGLAEDLDVVDDGGPTIGIRFSRQQQVASS